MASPIAGQKRKIEEVCGGDRPFHAVVDVPAIIFSASCSASTSGSNSRASTPPTDVPIEPALVSRSREVDVVLGPTASKIDVPSDDTVVVADSQDAMPNFSESAGDGQLPPLVPSQQSTASDADVSVDSLLTDISSLTHPTEVTKPPVQTTLDTITRKTVKRRVLTVPQVIPLHGTLEEMHCPKCGHVEQLVNHLNTLASGHSIYCPKCASVNASRNALGERTRGVGVMKVSVVLYGEEHKEAARVGEIAERDLTKAARPDFLIVAGTTLKIPGVKKLVKELTKVIKPETTLSGIETPVHHEGQICNDAMAIDVATAQVSQAASSMPKVIFVNNDSPNPESVWSSVFDTFVQGDIQAFASVVRQELEAYRSTHADEARATINKSAKKATKAVPGACNTLSNYFSSAKLGKTAGGHQSKHKKQHKRVISASVPLFKAPPAPKVPKEKCKPGWKGWAVDVVENKDIFLVETNLPPRRQRTMPVVAAKPAKKPCHRAVSSSASSEIELQLGESLADIRARLSAILAKDIDAVLQPLSIAVALPQLSSDVVSLGCAGSDCLNTTSSSTHYVADSQENKQLSDTYPSLLPQPSTSLESLQRTSSHSTNVVQDSQSPRLLSFTVDPLAATTELYSEPSMQDAVAVDDETDDEIHSAADSSSSLDQQSKKSLWASYGGLRPRFSPLVPSPMSSDSEEAEPFELAVPILPAVLIV